jgi:hypothetical protein
MARPAAAAVRLLTGEREPVRLATTADIGLSGLQFIDGTMTEVGDRVLVKDQADATRNGIYTASAGSWFRAADARTSREMQKGTTVHVQLGAVNADRVFSFVAEAPVVGADQIAIVPFLPPDLNGAVEDAEAAAANAAASAGQAAVSATAAAASAGQTAADLAATHADVVATAANVANTQLASAASGVYPNAYASALPRGVTGTTALVAGTGGTNGTFALGFSGGSIAGAAGTFTVSGGAVTAITITNTGLGSGTTPPTLSFTASAGLTGASATAVVGSLITAQKTYWALSADGSYLQLYQNDGTATPAVVANAALSAKAVVDAVASFTGSRTANSVPVTGTGTALANANIYFEPTSLKTFDEFMTGLTVAMSADGIVRIVVSKLEDDGTLSDAGILSQTFSVLAGVTSLIGIEISKPAGCVVGIQAVSGGYPLYTTGTILNGGARWSTTSIPASHTAKTIATTNGIQWSAVLTGEVTIKARRTDAQGVAIGKSALIGWSNIVATGTNTPANYSTVQQVPAAVDSYITGIQVGAGASATATVYAVKMNPDNTIADIKNATPITLVNGVANLATSIALPAGYRPAISGGAYKYQANNNPTGLRVHLKSGVMAIGDTLTDSASHRFEVNFTVESGLTADAHRALALASQAGGNTGLGLLSAADNTGVADATALFAAAAVSHPFPYVPPGTFSVTAIPNNGKGFWGPSKVLVNGVLMSLPEKPEFGSRFLKLRAALMPQIATGSCVIVNGDSISNGAYATNPRANHVGLLTRFANLGIALDEAVLVNFDNTDTSGGNAFHGISFASPSTPTYGTNNPVGKSLMLQPGQVLALAPAAYEKVDLTYQGVSGGQLAFAYNGTTYATVNTAATGNDVLASPGATGQSGSGTYTITNSGSVAIEITSLMRFGVKSGSLPRLVVCRMAHGSYTMASYIASRMQSMLRIATAAGGGSNHLVIPALGTNDAVGANLDYGQMRQATLDYAGRWVAAGVPVANILPIMPWRWSSYGTSSYQAELGGIRQGYRELGIRRVIQTDAFDFISEGMAGDGHPNDTGFIADFNAIVGALCDGAI